MDPVSPKVIASSVTAAIVSLVCTYVAKGADPTLVEAILTPVIAGVTTFAAGWLAKHSPKTSA